LLAPLAARTPAVPDRPSSTPDPNAANAQFSEWIAGQDICWHIQQAGRGTPMLLLHGTGSSTHSWRGLLPLMAEDHHVLAPDLPGLGQTRAPGAYRSLEGMARAVAGLLGDTGFQPRVAVGHSAGAAILVRMALDELISPDLIVGINAALLPFGGTLARALHPLARACSRLPMLSTLAAARARRPGAVERLIASTGSTLSPEGIADYRRLLGDETHVSATLAMMASWDLDDLVEDLPRLRTPLCLLVGSRDFAVPPSQAERIRSRAPAVRIQRLPGLGHLAHEERPDQVAEAIRRLEKRAGIS
jgi:magnesium chelatase accessory protein